MSTPDLTAFTDGLLLLRRSLADADPIATHDDPAAFSQALDRVTGAVADASPEDRSRYLLRALDDAIAALEVASRLADDLHASQVAGASQDAAAAISTDAVRMAYSRFAESQPFYQALYHYRNAVADQLRAAAPTPPPLSLTPDA